MLTIAMLYTCVMYLCRLIVSLQFCYLYMWQDFGHYECDGSWGGCWPASMLACLCGFWLGVHRWDLYHHLTSHGYAQLVSLSDWSDGSNMLPCIMAMVEQAMLHWDTQSVHTWCTPQCMPDQGGYWVWCIMMRWCPHSMRVLLSQAELDRIAQGNKPNCKVMSTGLGL